MTTQERSGRQFGVRSVYTLAWEWGTGSHLLAVPRIDVSRHCIRLEKNKAFKSVQKRSGEYRIRSESDCKWCGMLLF